MEGESILGLGLSVKLISGNHGLSVRVLEIIIIDAEKIMALDHCADVEKAAEDEFIDEVERFCDDVDCENVDVAGFEETIAEDAGSNEAKE